MRPGRGQDSRREPRTSPPCAPRTVGVRRDTTELLSRPRPAGSFHRARRRAGSALDRWGEAPAKRQTRGLARRRAPPVRPGAHGGGEKRGRHHRKKFDKKKARPKPVAGRTAARGDGHRARGPASARASIPPPSRRRRRLSVCTSGDEGSGEPATPQPRKTSLPIDRKRPSDGRSPGMDPGPQGAFEVSMINVSCNSHYFSQLAAFFIDA